MSNKKFNIMCKKPFNIVKAWNFNCEPKKINGENFVEVFPIPIKLPPNLTWEILEEIVENQPQNQDCCGNSNGLWYDGDKETWFTGSRNVAKTLIKMGAKIPEVQTREFFKV